MTQTFIVLSVIALALCWCLWHIVRTLQGKRDCGCGQGKHCKHRNTPRISKRPDSSIVSGKQTENKNETNEI